MSGGFGSALTGGNFWQGAATGLIVSGLNHEMHKLLEPDPIKKSFKEQLKAKGIKAKGRFKMENSNLIINAIDELKILAFEADPLVDGYNMVDGEYRVNYNGNWISVGAETSMNEKGTFTITMSIKRLTNLEYAYRLGHEWSHVVDLKGMNYQQYLKIKQSPQQVYERELKIWKNFNLKYGDTEAYQTIEFYENQLKLAR